ncbi:transposase for transposon Tn903, partial [Yersinia rohdei ATCC 43380]
MGFSNGMLTDADAGVIRASERERHQGKNGVNKSLRGA